jgi:dihydrofolate synthase/folylpolyglutamate synthase
MEVGMGGRLDATNAASGILSIITPISFDHCEYLGETIALIAGEKAGIIKPGRTVVTSSQPAEALAVISEFCARLHSPLHCFGSAFSAAWQVDGLAYHGLNWELSGLKPGIAGRYQAANAACAIFAAELLDGLGFNMDSRAARTGIETAFWPGRMEMLAGPPRVLLDGAHNPAGAAALAEALADIPYDRLILVAGIMANKDMRGVQDLLLPLADQVIAVTPGISRALPSAELASRCRAAGCSVIDGGPVASGLEIALRTAQPRDLILVCGSLYTVGEARAVLFSEKFEPFRG